MNILKEDVKKTYDLIGLRFSATRPHLSPEVISLLPALPPKAQVLDLGCGNGVLLTAFDRRSLGEGGPIDYTGIDFSPVLLHQASGLHPVGKFVLADIARKETWNNLGQFDLIVALALFHHLPSPDDHIKLLQNIKQHLNPTGSVLISVWNLNRPKFDRYRLDSKHLSIPFHNGPKRDFYAFSEDELSKLAKQAGFSDIKTKIVKDNYYLVLKTPVQNRAG
mgnify:CR=1 FL=1